MNTNSKGTLIKIFKNLDSDLNDQGYVTYVHVGTNTMAKKIIKMSFNEFGIPNTDFTLSGKEPNVVLIRHSEKFPGEIS